MGPLFTVTATPMRVVRMSEPGHFVSSSDLKSEQRRLLARRMLFGLRHQSGGSGSYVSFQDRAKISRLSSYASQDPRASSQKETVSSYTAERGAFELRVQRGDLTFIPPMVMTVIAQYPEIEFHYTGGFLYVPPSAAPKGQSLDLKG